MAEKHVWKTDEIITAEALNSMNDYTDKKVAEVPAGADGKDGAAGKSAYQVWEDAGNTGTEDDFIASLKGAKGDKGDKGDQGIQGVQGVQGVQGKAFQIAKTYDSVADMNASKGAGLSDGDFVMIASSVSDTDNAKLYTWNGTNFVYIDDLSGAQGIQGPQGPQGISGVNGKDATINVVTQAQYDALTDKSGVFFIEG